MIASPSLLLKRCIAARLLTSHFIAFVQLGVLSVSYAVNSLVRGFIGSATTCNLQFQFAHNTSTGDSLPVVKYEAILSWHTTS